METDNNIKNFSGADIEKYHKGLLSDRERHDLEKAALDDPFLADALEGYAVAGVDISGDMNDLRKRLAEKTEAGKVIPIKGSGKSSFPWLRAAALVIIIGGAGLLANQFIFRGTTKDIAQAEATKKEEIKPAENAATGTISAGEDPTKKNPGSVNIPLKQNEQNLKLTATDSAPGAIISNKPNDRGNAVTGDITAVNHETLPAVPAPVKAEDDKNNTFKTLAANGEKKDIASEEVKSKTEISNNQASAKEGPKGLVSPANEDQQKNRAVAAARKMADEKDYRNQAVKTFRGRVTDANNVGLPFANVTNAQDNNAGTYTDAKGYFNLTYPDTVLTVQVKSLGFENRNVRLLNFVASNQVVMQEDRKSLSEVVVNNKKPNAAVRRDNNNVKLEEPEPADGWENYDTYLTNNLNAPEEIKTKPNTGGEVQVSFEVDKNGEPVSFKVEKSLCDQCDKEAIRLIKEGPKWKRNAKKGRTTVTISFDHPL